MRLLFLLALLVSLCAATTPSRIANAPAITVLSCIVGARADTRPGVTVSFRNDSALDLSQIVWRVRVFNGWIDYTDNGNFAPGSVSSHSLFYRSGGLLGYYRSGTELCAAIAATAKTGETWLAPGMRLDPDQFFPPVTQESLSPEPLIADPTRDPIDIVSCVLAVWNGRRAPFQPLHGRADLSIHFRNASNRQIQQIVFRGEYLSGGLNFIYGHPVSPGGSVTTSRVKTMLGTPVLAATLMRDDLPVVPEFMSAPDPSGCAVVSVHFADDTIWQNPDTGPTEPPLPTAPPTLAP